MTSNEFMKTRAGQATTLLIFVAVLGSMVAGAVAFNQVNRLPALFQDRTNDIVPVTTAETKGNHIFNNFAPLAAEFSAGEAVYRIVAQEDTDTNEYPSKFDCLDKDIINNNLDADHSNGDAAEFSDIYDEYSDCATNLSTTWFKNYSDSLNSGNCRVNLNVDKVEIASADGEVNVVPEAGESVVDVTCTGEDVTASWESGIGENIADDMARNTFPQQITLLHKVTVAMENTAESLEAGEETGGKELDGLQEDEKGDNPLVGEVSAGQNYCTDISEDSDATDDDSGPHVDKNTEFGESSLYGSYDSSQSGLEEFTEDVVQEKFDDKGVPTLESLHPLFWGFSTSVTYEDFQVFDGSGPLGNTIPSLGNRDHQNKAKDVIQRAGRCQAEGMVSNTGCSWGFIGDVIDFGSSIAGYIPRIPDHLSMEYDIDRVEWDVRKERWTEDDHPPGENPGFQRCGCEDWACSSDDWKAGFIDSIIGNSCQIKESSRPTVKCPSSYRTYQGKDPDFGAGEAKCRNDNLDSGSDICPSSRYFENNGFGTADKCVNNSDSSDKVNTENFCSNQYDGGNNYCWKAVDIGNMECDPSQIDGYNFAVEDEGVGQDHHCVAQSTPDQECTDEKHRYVVGYNWSIDEVRVEQSYWQNHFDDPIPTADGWNEIRINRTFVHDFPDEEVAWR